MLNSVRPTGKVFLLREQSIVNKILKGYNSLFSRQFNRNFHSKVAKKKCKSKVGDGYKEKKNQFRCFSSYFIASIESSLDNEFQVKVDYRRSSPVE